MAHPLFRANQQENEVKQKAKQPPLNFAKSLDYLIKEHLIKRLTLERG